MKYKNEIDRVFAVKYIGLQVLVVICLSLASLLISIEAGLSSFIGGCIAVTGNFYLIRKILRPVENKSAELVLASLYLDELAKVGMTLLLFFMAFKWVDALKTLENVVFMLLCFTAVQSVHFIAHVFYKSTK